MNAASQARATVAPTARRIVCRLTVPSKRDGVMRCRITDAPARERYPGHGVSLLLGSEWLLRHRVDRHSRLRLPRLEFVDDEHDTAHADPVAGKRADVDTRRVSLAR